MLNRSLCAAGRLHGRLHVFGAAVGGYRPEEAGVACNASRAFATTAIAQTSSCLGANKATKAPQQQPHQQSHISIDAASASGVNYLHQALGIAAEHALVARLAAAWKIPAEILQANVLALADMLQPCGRDTSAHALWVLVRCPELRHFNEQQLRSTFRKLTWLVRHLDIDRPALLAAVYKRPWMLTAAMTAPPTPPAAGPAAAGPAAADQAPSPASTAATGSTSSSSSPLAPWKRELALLLLELQAYQTPNSSNSSSTAGVVASSASPTLALAAVRGYLTLTEAAQKLGSSIKSAVPLALLRSSPAIFTKVAATAAAGSCSTTSSTSLQCTQDKPQPEQQQQVLLQQLLTVCPSLMMLPPEVLAARWQLLLSGLLGQPEAAVNLVRTSPYILVDYADCPQEGVPAPGF